MIDIFLLGHGFWWVTPKKFRVEMPLKTYVADNGLLDGSDIGPLFQDGAYGHPAHMTTYFPGVRMDEHLLCSDSSTLNDVADCAKWTTYVKKQEAHAPGLFTFRGGFGRLEHVAEGSYIYRTDDGYLTRLSDIQHNVKLFAERMLGSEVVSERDPRVTLHWAACRSKVAGTSKKQVIGACTSGLAAPKGIRGEVDDPVADQLDWIETPIGGFYGSEVEGVITTMPGVQDCGVYALAAQGGRAHTAVHAVVVKKAGSDVNDYTIGQYLSQHNVTQYKRPARIHMVARIPRTSERRVDVKALGDLAS
jgi:AMP-binding enzyme C-terminal domain